METAICMKQLTDKEKDMLRRFAANDIVSDYGWQDKLASAWTNDLCGDRADAAVVGSLMRKGIMWNNGECVGLTDAGRAAMVELVANLTRKG